MILWEYTVLYHITQHPSREIPPASLPSARSCFDSIKFHPSQSEGLGLVTSVAVHLFSLISPLPQSFPSSFALALLLLSGSSYLPPSPPGLLRGGEEKHADGHKHSHSSTCKRLCRWYAILHGNKLGTRNWNEWMSYVKLIHLKIYLK